MICEAIATTEALIAKLKAIKQGLLHDVLTCGLDDNGELRDPERHPEQFKESPIGRIPKQWLTSRLDEITAAPICYGIVQPGPHVSDGVPVVAIRDLQGDFITNVHKSSKGIEASYQRSRVVPGDVLLSIKGTTGRLGIVPRWYQGNISRDIARLRPNVDILPAYLRYVLESPQGQKLLDSAVVGTTRAELSIKRLKDLRLPIPTRIEEQKLIVEHLEAFYEGVRTEESTSEKLRSVKRGLMQDLLTGRVRVPQEILECRKP